jgi:hypothetical protein
MWKLESINCYQIHKRRERKNCDKCDGELQFTNEGKLKYSKVIPPDGVGVM